MHSTRTCQYKRSLHNPAGALHASCQAKDVLLRPPAPFYVTRAHDYLDQPIACSWCGCFQWQCGHHHRHRGPTALCAASSHHDEAASYGEKSFRQSRAGAAGGVMMRGADETAGDVMYNNAMCGANGGCSSPPAVADGDVAAEGASSRREGVTGGEVSSDSQRYGWSSGDPDSNLRNGSRGVLCGTPCWQQLQQQEKVEPETEARQFQAAQTRTSQKGPCRLRGDGNLGGALLLPLQHAWDPGTSAATQFPALGSGPGPPLQPHLPSPPSSPPLGEPPQPLPQAWEPSAQTPLEPSLSGLQAGGSGAPSQWREAALLPSQLSTAQIAACGRERPLEPSLGFSMDRDVAGPASSCDGLDAGAGALTAAAANATVGAVFRSALRRCRCLADLEALLDGHAPPPLLQSIPLPSPSLPPPLPSVDLLSVPSLTAVISALPRLPDAFTAAGRRRIRHFLMARMTRPVVLAAQRDEVDAAGAAIMAAALSQLGPDVVDPRVGCNDLLDALAAAGLAACRLPLEPSLSIPSWPSHMRQYGHSPRSYSTLLYGMAKLGFRPDDSWLDRYLATSLHWLRSFSPRDIAAVAWALAVLQYRPREAWLSALLAGWPRGSSSLHVGNGVGAGNGIQNGAPDPWAAGGAAAAAAAASGATALRRADSHSLSLLLWALWRLGIAAPPAWLHDAVTLCAVPSIPGVTLASVGRQSQPSQVPTPFAAATCQSLALMSYCLARMGHTPPARVRMALLAAAEPLLQRGSAQDLVLLLTGVAHWPQLRGEGATSSSAASVVPERWLQQICFMLRQRLAGCSAQALVLALSALAHLRFSPGPAWLREHEAALRPLICAGHLDGRAAARVAAAWARLQYQPGRNVVDRLLKMLVTAAAPPAPAGGNMYGSAATVSGATRQRRWLSARLFAEGLYGIAVLVAVRRTAGGQRTYTSNGSPQASYAPSAPLLASIHVRALLAASQSRLPYSYLDEALLHLHAWRLLRLVPPHQWLANMTAVVRIKLHSAPPTVLLELLQLLGWSGWRLLRSANPVAAQEGSRHVYHHHPRHMLYDSALLPVAEPTGGGASGTAGLPVSTALVVSIMERLAADLPEMSVRQLADLALAVAVLRVRPTRAWLRQLLDAVRGAIQRAKPGLDPNPDLTAANVARTDADLGGNTGVTSSGQSDVICPPAIVQEDALRALRATSYLGITIGDTELQRCVSKLLLSEYGIVASASASMAAVAATPAVAAVQL